MQNNYILRNKDNELLSFYYGEGKSIYCKKLGSNNYPIVSKVIQDVTDYFTVDISPNNDICIFCQNYRGDIILCKLEQDNFKNKILFKNKNESPENILFYPIFFRENMSLIYNTPNQNYNNGFLSIKTLIGGKNWTNSENIDNFNPIPNNMFYIQKINDENIILAYQKNNKDLQIGYKEIKNGSISDFITIHKTGYQIVDYSFIYFNEIIHYIYIIKTLFSSQVIYKQKNYNGISNHIILFEGQRIKSCNISILNNNLYCSFIVNSTLYYCQSEDFGKTFIGMTKYRKNVSQDIIKAKFISANKIENNSINDVYIDEKNPLNIYLLPEILPNLFNKTINNNSNNYNNKQNEQDNFITNLNSQFTNNTNNMHINIPKNTNNSMNKPIHQISNNINLENDFMSNFNLEEFANINTKNYNNYNNISNNIPNDKIDFNQNVSNNSNNIDSNYIFENRIQILNEQLNEKNNQILKLNNLIQNKNSEKTDIEVHLRQKVRNMESENNNLLQKINSLQKQIENIKNKNKNDIIITPKESEDISQNNENMDSNEKQSEEN